MNVTSDAEARRPFPDEEQHRRRWRELARAIAAESGGITDDPGELTAARRPGQLEVLGSGIEAAGFTASDEQRIREADQVFYCVADPATVVWLKDLRPDAYDLYVLYDDRKQRYLTYAQMTEAVLHYVREGQKVVAVYYGHPGIFVLSTHRAIGIARREGHRAVMRPAVSALDALCADLGVDPSQPGMQMYEATDLLIRRRRPDPGLHLVLWQVGLIGELGYRRQGHINGNFPVLLDYLAALYGEDHPVVNYVGARYPGVDPVIDRQTIESLRDPGVQERVTGISTFYLPPREIAQADEEMLRELGLLQPGQRVRRPESPLRVIDRYGERERGAFRDLANFEVPDSYHWQADTGAARFILSLRDDGELRERYRRDPAGAVQSWSGALSDREKRLLAQREAGAMQVAAKGLRTANSPENRRFLDHLLGRKTATRSLLRTWRRSGDGRGLRAAEQWSRDQGFSPDWRALPGDLEVLLRQNLYPWTGLYLAKDRELSLSVHGRPGRGQGRRVDLNGRRLRGAQYQRGILSWSATEGNDCSGHLQADATPGGGVRRLVGLVWPPGSMPGSEHRVVVWEHALPAAPPLCAVAGRYWHRRRDGSEESIAIEPIRDAEAGLRMRVTVDGRETDRPVAVDTDGLRLGDYTVPFSARLDDDWPPAHLHGRYRVRAARGDDVRFLELGLGSGMISVGGDAGELRRNGAEICWRGGPPAMSTGAVHALLDPISLRPMLFGQARSAAGETFLLRGMAPVTAAEEAVLAANPQLGLPGWAWKHVSVIVAGASRSGGLFLWHGWERTATNLRRLRAMFRELGQL